MPQLPGAFGPDEIINRIIELILQGEKPFGLDKDDVLPGGRGQKEKRDGLLPPTSGMTPVGIFTYGAFDPGSQMPGSRKKKR